MIFLAIANLASVTVSIGLLTVEDYNILDSELRKEKFEVVSISKITLFHNCCSCAAVAEALHVFCTTYCKVGSKLR